MAARVDDAIRLCDTTDMYKSVGFLSAEEASFVRNLPQLKSAKHTFFGGYDGAERVCFVALPDWCDNADNLGIIESYTLLYRKCDKLSHRDFLGTLMSLGITRETVGDILCEDGRAVLFVLNSVSKYIGEQLIKVGGVGVSVNKGFEQPLPGLGQLKDFSATVASLRLDCVIAALLNTSREKSKEIILEKRVFVDSVLCDKITSSISENSKISVKGFGKFILNGASLHTKKGRIILDFSKYI